MWRQVSSSREIKMFYLKEFKEFAKASEAARCKRRIRSIPLAFLILRLVAYRYPFLKGYFGQKFPLYLLKYRQSRRDIAFYPNKTGQNWPRTIVSNIQIFYILIKTISRLASLSQHADMFNLSLHLSVTKIKAIKRPFMKMRDTACERKSLARSIARSYFELSPCNTMWCLYLMGPYYAGPNLKPAPLTPAFITPVSNCAGYKKVYISAFNGNIRQKI